mmetsp:Transcript_15946/g.41241  ORF Transcript_15946/g.41241 Transcript_15946/m.41241 type:complete len:87 (+) Transcript_15946:613-873(+)
MLRTRLAHIHSHAQVEAFEETQKYKEGKFILEKAMISKEEDPQLHRFVEQELPETERRAVSSAGADDAGATQPVNAGMTEPVAVES